ncbi:ferritin-like fold-containing protein [Hamadaea tsunoensis]|uniref:ferritin-like fold-containing protein n=1 Tax=Hamadaea tsunoensis TaxID=53368 RepID=UPI000420E453|nr:ferritin-like fold-containing protein [Hamadaea tsunoensis]
MSQNTLEPGVRDLLGLLAYAQLLAFDRMAADARLAPDLHRRAVLCEMAAVEIGNYRQIADRLGELGLDPAGTMAPFVEALVEYHEATEPTDWLEALTKAYIGDGIADDFYREVAASVGPVDRDLVLRVLHANAYDDFARDEIRAAVAADPKAASRLSMWARRLVGEALSQAVRVAEEHADLVVLLGDGGAELFDRLKQAHGDRMAAVGLNN